MPEERDSTQRRLDLETRSEIASRLPAGGFLVPGLTVLYHPDVSRVGERVLLPGLASGRQEGLARAEPAFSRPGRNLLRPLGDPYLSRRPVVLAAGSAPGGVRLSCGGTNTTVEVDGVPVADEREIAAEEMRRGAVLLLAGRVVLLLSWLDPLGAGDQPDFGLVGESLPMAELRREIRRVASLEVPVLLRGETGSGKELVARALHDGGPRARRPFLAVNMGAVPPTLAAAELFGAARGAYTGADRRRMGFFSRAQGGTLFLDEIGETPPEVQPLLLRALESGEIQPVGEEETYQVDVRVVAATDSDLEAAVAANRFRAPLLHRLAAYEILLPPLRARREDFGRLMIHLLRQELATMGASERLELPVPEARPWLPAPLVARLALHSWPGNVRQLRNAVRQLAVAGHDTAEVTLSEARLERLLAGASEAKEAPPREAREPDTASHPAPLPRSRKSYRRAEEVSEDELLAALQANRWRLKPTAAQLGIARTSLYDRIEKSPRIHKAADLSREEIERCSERCGGDLDLMVEILEVSKRGLQHRMKQHGLL
ncbi:MAG TPA: sigma-54 dependent transcriptional regulator [Thermoanaerobaculia bacterium]|nr:sigma-54 dependent transcriptional regulator [Thermoanaerobaculia bacterium]